jgi:hypothetical protein
MSDPDVQIQRTEVGIVATVNLGGATPPVVLPVVCDNDTERDLAAELMGTLARRAQALIAEGVNALTAVSGEYELLSARMDAERLARTPGRAAMVLGEVLVERRAQDTEWGQRHDDTHDARDWLTVLGKHTGRAAGAALNNDWDPYRRQLVIVAAVAVAAVEAFDRVRETHDA